jgi:hypothetical protein
VSHAIMFTYREQQQKGAIHMQTIELLESFIQQRLTTTEIFDYLRANNIPSISGRPWTIASVQNTLRSIKTPSWRPITKMVTTS